jgi:glycosyltransferase involved in cell wall biosynthesis
MRGQPTVSIGLPVFNGERYLRKAIESILAQSYGDFELILSDNASSDGTADICSAFSTLDERVRFERNATNCGAAANFNRVVHRARSPYFKWAAHDDLLDKTYLARTLAALEAAPDAIAAHTHVAFIDEHDRVVRDDPFPLRHVGSPLPSKRFADVVSTPHWSFWAFALIRREALLRTDLIGAYASSDRVLIAHLALLGRFVEVPDVLFLSRDHPERALKRIPERLRLRRLLRAVGPLPAAEWYDPARQGRIAFPQWHLWRRYLDLVRHTDLQPSERRRCYLALVRGLATNRNAAKFLRDVALAGEQILLRLAGGTRTEVVTPSSSKRRAS